jgi:hypothetical protein
MRSLLPTVAARAREEDRAPALTEAPLRPGEIAGEGFGHRRDGFVVTPLLGQQLAAYGVPSVARRLANQRRQPGCRPVPLRYGDRSAERGGRAWGHRKQQIIQADDLVPIGPVAVRGAVMLSGDRRLKLVRIRDGTGSVKALRE